MADQLYRSTAAFEKRMPSWDVESILTGAVYRAFNNGNTLISLDHPGNPSNVDKGYPTTDAQLQLKLVVEKLRTRMERRYEKRLSEQREKDRVEATKKLADIRAEYAEQIEMSRRELEREKRRLEEQFAEKDRTLRDRMQMQLSEKESVLEIARKSLETRMAEIVANKEHLDRAKADFHAKFAADVDSLNQEWAKICAKKEELKSVFRLEFEAEQRDLKEKSAALEKENALLKKKLKDCTMGLDEMQSKLTKMANLEIDLAAAVERGRREMEERHRLTRCSFEADRLREENVFLKEEIEQLKSILREQKSQISKSRAEQIDDQVYSKKIKELRSILGSMSEKIGSLTCERDYLRGMLRDAQARISVGSKAMLHSSTAPAKLRSHVGVQGTDSGEDTSISSSSGCASDLRDIRQRFSNLEDLAKTLNTTIECVSAARSTKELSTPPVLPNSNEVDYFHPSSKEFDTGFSISKPAVDKGELLQSSPILEGRDFAKKNTSVEEPNRKELTSFTVTYSAVPSNSKSDDSADQGVVENEKSEEKHLPKIDSIPEDSYDAFAERLRSRNNTRRNLNLAAVVKENVTNAFTTSSTAQSQDQDRETDRNYPFQSPFELQRLNEHQDPVLEPDRGLIPVEGTVNDQEIVAGNYPESADEIEW